MACIARCYNNSNQTVTEESTTLNLLGSIVVDNTSAVTINTSSVRINNGGLYHICADVTFTPTETTDPSVFTISWANNGVTLPCTITTESTTGIATVHTETDIQLNRCCMITPNLTLNIEGAAGTVSHICAAVSR